MKTILLAACLSTLSIATYAQKKAAVKKPVAKKTTITKTTRVISGLRTGLDSTSYAFGTSIGAGLKTTGLSALNYEMLIKGLKDSFTGGKLILTPQQAQENINAAITKASAVKNKAEAEANKIKYGPMIKEGQDFLEENKKRAGVQTTASGLQYEVITAGTGVKPIATDSVLVHYKGTLLNGKQFDSSYDRGEPISFPLNRVIPGWTEGVQLMPAGSKYKFFIPYQLAYGERGAGADIPPYSALIFEVELLKVNGK
ncbi:MULTISPECIES: FKBP-type peptidyl-prolyl cis-trans isomerase [unclassified Pedobacter]|jgi:FKBP-type peptidyl-prolyl cis-trans isomerase FklB|uniref:FKBP-type peptidyl-prolyl cis-trans isomerase n=1 Tax=unclassified Pedobacter TaxID=2628915 RepID=UPI000B4B00FC|nr:MULTISPECIES: FKBP-type peptidyl-prolyl cis-trans isomerase [unclassified Pedobacter]MCX2433003.1 FKBP-type peptidyl-prolyl cis-trans isomerase [Pedobacter sp. GR22-10]OWK72173.1 peptidylprolyl isomerase [Pedobacter sp. AJM]